MELIGAIVWACVWNQCAGDAAVSLDQLLRDGF